MKTTSEQLLARALELEQTARALRIAATEMNGHQTAEKVEKAGALFQAAAQMRQAVKIREGRLEPVAAVEAEPPAPELPPLPKRQRYRNEELAPYLLATLEDGATRTTLEIAQAFTALTGRSLHTHNALNHLNQLPGVVRAGGGRGTDVVWKLKGAKSLGGRKRGYRWTATQRKKFLASMKRKSREKQAAFKALAEKLDEA